MRAIIPVYAACAFRTAARIVRIVVGEPLGNAKRDLASIIFGDAGETLAPVLGKVSHAVVQAAQRRTLSWDEFVTRNLVEAA